MRHRRDKLNVTLHVLKHMEFDNSDDDKEFMVMPIPPPKRARTIKFECIGTLYRVLGPF